MIKVKMYTRQGCHWCEKWHEDEENWMPPNWNLEKIQGGVSSYPTFIVSVDTKSKTLIGYQSIAGIQKAIQELQDE